MKNLRLLLPITSLLVFSSSFTWAENPLPPGSIRPTAKLAKVDLPAAAKISFETALQAALAAVPGSVLKGKIEVEDGTLIYSFEIVVADKSITEVNIDAGNGKVLATEKEEPKSAKKEHKKEKEEKD